MRLLYVVDNSFYDFKPQKPSLVTIRSIVIEHTLRGSCGNFQSAVSLRESLHTKLSDKKTRKPNL